MKSCALSALMICLPLLPALCQIAPPTILLGFDTEEGGKLVDADGHPRAELRGEARASDDAHTGKSAVAFGGAEEKGVVDFGSEFGTDHQATISFWCKPRALSGILVGKYGAINIELTSGAGVVRFGLKLKTGWVHCQSPEKAVAPGEWAHIKASWGEQGMLLFIGDKLVARAELPETFDWFIADRAFLLGCYSWPPDYDVWCYEGLIDEFAYTAAQETFTGALPAPPPPVLELLLRETPKPAYGAPLPKTVRGRVVIDADGNTIADAGEAGVPDVSVTDGYSVVKTDETGAYAITPSPDAVFVFITRPPGHDTVGNWYKPVAEKVDFALKPAELDESQFTFIQVTDSHVSTRRRSLEGLSQFVTEANALRPAPRFVFNSGDLINLDKQLNASAETGHAYFRNYVGIMNHLDMPYYNVAGDHTDSSYRLEDFPLGDHRAGKALYWEYLGPQLFSFEYGRLHFVSVDIVYHMEDAIRHEMVPEHVAWLKQDLGNRTSGAVSLTASEHHLEGYVPGFVELAKEEDIRLQLTGDMHVVAEKKRPVPSRIHGALSGTWWTGRCADLSPQGYMIYHVRGTSMECFYKGLGERVAIVSPTFGEALSGEVTLQAHLVQPKAGESLEFSVDGGAWVAMAEAGRPFYRALYEAKWDTRGLPDGLAEVRVRSVPDGETRTRVFVVDNGRPSVSPGSDASLTFSVGNVIMSPLKPAATVGVLMNGISVGNLEAGKVGEYTFRVPADILRKINTLSFDCGDTREPFAITHPFLHIGQEAIADPKSAAIQRVQAAHWDKGVVERAGFVIGDDPYQGSFYLLQERFHFVLPDAVGKEDAQARD